MDLTDRYLAAIGRNLPAKQADDIVAELRDTLLSQREDKEAELGRALTDQEVETLLREFGHPLMVAARYGQRQYLIGPEFYPFYIYTLRTVLLIVAAVLVTLGIAGVVFSAGDPGKVIVRALGGIWTGGLITTGVITILFAVFERYAPPATFLRNWRPQDLPRFEEKAQSRWSMIANLTAGAVFILWWTGVIHLPHVINAGDGSRLDVVPAPVWKAFFWPILGIAALGMVRQAVILVRPNWLKLRSLLNLAAGVIGLVILGLLYRAGHWADVTGAGVAPDTLSKVEQAVNIGARVTLVVVGISWTVQCLVEGWKVWKSRDSSGPMQ